MKKDWDLEENYTTNLNPIFRIWKTSKGWYYVCKTDYEENTDRYFKTEENLMKHIKTMLNRFAKAHRLFPWKFTEIDREGQGYTEDFGFGDETYQGIFQAYTMNDAPDYVRMGELVDKYLEIVK